MLLAVENLSSRLQRVGESKLLKSSWVEGAAGGRESKAYGMEVLNRVESFQQNLLINPVGRDETFLQTIFVHHVKQQFSVPTFCGSVWKSWRNSPIC